MPTLRIALFIASSLAAIFLGFILLDGFLVRGLFGQAGYWFILIALGTYLISLYNSKSSDLKSWFSEPSNRWLCILCIIAATFLYSREGGGFKILFDEHNLSVVAQSFHFDREAAMQQTSLFGEHSIPSLDKRPLLYPFLVSIIHDIFGYRIENAFYLNWILTGLFLVLLFEVTKSIAGRVAGYFAILLACAMPLVEQNSSNSHFEMLNLVCILLCWQSAQNFLKDSTLKTLGLLVSSAILLCHTRQESPFFLLPISVIILAGWIRSKSVVIPWQAIVAPLLLIPIAWQNQIVSESPGLWQFVRQSDGAFSLSYIPENLINAVRFMLIPNWNIPNSPFVTLFGVIALVGVATKSSSQIGLWLKTNPERFVAFVFGIGISAHMLLILAFTYGQLDDPVVSRLGLPFVLLLILCAAIALGTFWKTGVGRKFGYAYVFVCFCYAIPVYSSHKYTSNQVLHERIDWVLDFHDRLPQGNYLYITRMHTAFQLKQINNMSVARAREKSNNLLYHLNLNTYDDIFVIQHGSISTQDHSKALLPNNDLGNQITLEPLDEISLRPFTFTRISRITKIEPIAEKLDPVPDPVHLDNSVNLISDEAYQEWKKTLP